MVITAQSGPMVTYGTVVSASGATQEYNEERGPSLNDLGSGLLDPRYPYNYLPGDRPGSVVGGFLNNMGIVDQIPATKSSLAIVAQTVGLSAGAALTLTTSLSSAGFTPNVSLTAPETGKTVTVSVIDGSTTQPNWIGSANPQLTFGSAGTIGIWNPSMGVARTLTVAPTSNADAGTFTVAGRDIYGFKITEQFTAGSTTIVGKKAFKYISSILASTTLTSTGVAVGFNDVFGFPMRVDTAGYATVWWGASSNATLISLSTGAHTFAAGTSITQTSTTADVRGTINTSAASNSTGTAPVRLQMFVNLNPVNLLTVTSTNYSGIFGMPQFSSV